MARLKAPGFFPIEYQDGGKSLLIKRFTVPPFSVLDARAGYWQARKRAWLALGIQSELGRGENLLLQSEQVTNGAGKPLAAKTYNSGGPGTLGKQLRSKAIPGGGGTGKNSCYLFKTPQNGYKAVYKREGGDFTAQRMAGIGKRLTWVAGDRDKSELDDTSRRILEAQASGTSIFDPVLCECVYRWFVPAGGKVLDPFAGGSVRGIVAAHMGYRYAGVDLSGAQIAANRKQVNLLPPDSPKPLWAVGDSRKILRRINGKYDAVFTCPPYSTLERYSTHPADLSNMEYAEFLTAYTDIIAQACAKLKENRFAAIVVGEVRGKAGPYYGLVPDTINAFKKAGLHYYNSLVLLTAVGSLPIRAGKQFDASRKIGCTHQHLLVFVKGNAKKAVAAIRANSSRLSD